eukprot:GHVT01061167.1.p1 GENE.GHVT01061167.1~~GHVT01061167.1.p1  ORF type:complete len:233 (+),score=38.47 GHVT01061167.1:117-815(+)
MNRFGKLFAVLCVLGVAAAGLHVAAAVPKLVLYGHRPSRSNFIETFLKANSVDYDFKEVKLMEGEHKTPEYLEISPFGVVPALKTKNATISQTSAILVYLSDRFGQLPNSELRGVANMWVTWAFADLVNDAFTVAKGTNDEKTLEKMILPIEVALKKNKYISGPRYTVADFAVYSVLEFISSVEPEFFAEMTKDRAAVLTWLTSMRARPTHSGIRPSSDSFTAIVRKFFPKK